MLVHSGEYLRECGHHVTSAHYYSQEMNWGIKRFYGNSINAVKTQVWIAVCVYVLVAILKKELQLPQSLHSILQVLSVSVFEKVPLNQLLTTTPSENYQSPREITEIESYANFRSSRQTATSSTST